MTHKINLHELNEILGRYGYKIAYADERHSGGGALVLADLDTVKTKPNLIIQGGRLVANFGDLQRDLENTIDALEKLYPMQGEIAKCLEGTSIAPSAIRVKKANGGYKIYKAERWGGDESELNGKVYMYKMVAEHTAKVSAEGDSNTLYLKS